MTISSVVTLQAYTGNGVTLEFPVPFIFFGETEIEVIERVISTGAETTMSLTTHYTVAGGNGSTGTVKAVLAPSSLVRWFIRRVTARKQEIDYVANDSFPAETHERGLDRRAAVEHEIEEVLSRAFTIPKTDEGIVTQLPNSITRANKFLSFDGSGNPTVATAVSGTAISVAMEPVVTAATLVVALQALGIYGDISYFRWQNFR